MTRTKLNILKQNPRIKERAKSHLCDMYVSSGNLCVESSAEVFILIL